MRSFVERYSHDRGAFHSVSNGVDLVVIMKQADEQVLERVISEQITMVEGVTLSQVLLSPRKYSLYNFEDD